MSGEGLQKKVLSGLVWKFGERIGAQLVSLLVRIILARILMPEDFGVVTMIMIFIEIANVFVVSGFGQSLIQKKDADNLDFSSVFYFSVTMSWILYFIIFLGSPVVASFYGKPVLTPILRVLALKLPLASINSVQQAYVQKHMMFKRFFFSTLIGTLVSAVVGIVMAYIISGISMAPVAISGPAIAVAVLFSTLIGVIFGMVPSVKAANMNPIDALRHE